MGHGHREYVGVGAVKFSLSQDQGEMVDHRLSTTLCFWISLSLVI